MCLSTLVLVPAITGKGAEKVLKIFCAINGFLAVPTLVFTAMRFSQSGAGSSDAFGCVVLLFFCIIFLPVPIIFARLFRAKLKQASTGEDRAPSLATAAGPSGRRPPG